MKGTKPQLVLLDLPKGKAEPEAPEWMGEFAKAEWRRAIPYLFEKGIITESDMASFENYCVAQGYVRQFQAALAKSNSVENQARLFRMVDKAMATARQLAAELGLTPVSRSRPAVRDLFDDEGGDPLNVG